MKSPPFAEPNQTAAVTNFIVWRDGEHERWSSACTLLPLKINSCHALKFTLFLSVDNSPSWA